MRVKVLETFIMATAGLSHGWHTASEQQGSSPSRLLIPQLINSNIHEALMKRVVLETVPYSTSWKIQVLLEKISRSLSLLTVSDLEDFIVVVNMVFKDLSAKYQLWS